MKSKWKRRFFYLRRGLIRWAVVFFGTLLAQCGLVWILENPDSRMMFYLISGTVIAFAIGNVFYGRELPKCWRTDGKLDRHDADQPCGGGAFAEKRRMAV